MSWGYARTCSRRWQTEAEGSAPADLFPGKGHLPPAEAELRRLCRELEEVKQENLFLKKSGRVLREGVAQKYAVIRSHEGAFRTSVMCRALSVSRSGYYA